MHAPFPLHGFHDESRRGFVDRRLGGGEITVGHEARARHQRLVRLAILLAPRHAQGAHRLAVVATLGAHKSDAAGGGAGHLEGRFHCFRPAVGEKRVLQTFRRDFGQAARQRPLHGVKERLAA